MCGLQVQLLISLKLRVTEILWNTNRSLHTFNNWEL